MRVITGSLKGRQFDSPPGHNTHPMSDKIRGGLFGALGDIGGLTVLDAFAGSGALSIEAISRGAKEVTAVEIDKEAMLTIRANITNLGISDQVTLLHANVHSWSRRNYKLRFDLVFCDPPFDQLQYETIEKLEKMVDRKGLLVLSWPVGRDLPRFPELVILREKSYGDAQLLFYRRLADAPPVA